MIGFKICQSNLFLRHRSNGAELAGATGARAPVLFLPRPEILGHILYVLSRFSGQIPEIPRPRPVVHLHYLGHFGASANICEFSKPKQCWN